MFVWFVVVILVLICVFMRFICPNHIPLRWRHNGRDGVSDHRGLDCLLNRLSRRRSKKHQSSASPAFVRGIHRWPGNSPRKRPVTQKKFPFDDVIMWWCFADTGTIVALAQCYEGRIAYWSLILRIPFTDLSMVLFITTQNISVLNQTQVKLICNWLCTVRFTQLGNIWFPHL